MSSPGQLLFLLLTILLPLSTYAFIEGLYCGTENCYDGKLLYILLEGRLIFH